MCGICGIVLKRPNDNLQAAEVCRLMGESIRHRGPDARGEWDAPDRGIYFEHRRLAIIDLSAAAEQPFFNERKNLSCLVNGEIYNHRELRNELSASGHQFRSECDVEVVVHLFEEGGVASWKKLRGMYAISLYDQSAGTLYLARDPLGIKPLYLYEDENLIAFSSEIRAFQKIPRFSNELDWNGLSEFLLLGSISSPHTHLKNVRSLEPGEILQIKENTITRIAKPSVTDLWKSSAEEVNSKFSIEEAKLCLRDSVAKHLISDVPIGIFLSGGIDSGTLAGIASEISSNTVHTVSVTIPGDELDESAYARDTAKLYRTRHEEVPLEQKSFEADFESFFAHLDQPSIDGFNTYIVSKAARSAGLTVALSGVGGDEIFGGYNSFQIVPKLNRFHKIINLGGPIGRTAGASLMRILRNGSAGLRVSDYLQRDPFDLRHAYMASRGIFSKSFLNELFLPDARSSITSAEDRILNSMKWASQPGISEAVAVGGLELTRYMRMQLLRDTDVMSMAHSLEVRTPLVDKEVVRTCLPFLGTKLQTDGHPKWLLRQALRTPLPQQVVSRPKQGFVFPWQKWLQGFVLKDFDKRIGSEKQTLHGLDRQKLKWWRDAYVRGWAHWSCFWALYVLVRFIENHPSSKRS